MISEQPAPVLPLWAEDYWSWQKTNYAGTGTTKSRLERAERAIEVMKSDMIQQARKSTLKLQASTLKLQACGFGCAAAFFPDMEVCVGDATIPVNREMLVRSSPFFSTMLKNDGEMREATSKQITFPAADVQVVRQLLSLIYSSGVALDALKLSLSELMDLLAQAAEWLRCHS